MTSSTTQSASNAVPQTMICSVRNMRRSTISARLTNDLLGLSPLQHSSFGNEQQPCRTYLQKTRVCA